ncbi:MAG: sigma-70 family RNA polymerase sigma factor [Woeseiaceae bacterium]|nr:sigma-70 family RNA polymerase sigma factor [Woeseiaceae bacterium]
MTGIAEPDAPGLDELLQAVASQNLAAFEAFYEATTERALNLVQRITRNLDLAEEVVSDVYLQVWRQADRFDPSRGNALAWLTVLCRSRALDAIRKDNISPTNGAASIADVPETEAPEFAQDLLLAVERDSAIHEAMRQLQPDQRQLLALAYFRGYSHSELAQFTGMPLGTVKTRLRRTIDELKDLLAGTELVQGGSA